MHFAYSLDFYYFYIEIFISTETNCSAASSQGAVFFPHSAEKGTAPWTVSLTATTNPVHRMRRITLTAIAAVAALTLLGSRRSDDGDILSRMRGDTLWIRRLDSLAAEAIGPGAECLDPVAHLFRWEGRSWLFNQDWGGVMDIPSGYIVEDDPWQAVVSYHGSRAWSPDSLVLVSVYAGLQTFSPEEYADIICDSLGEDGFSLREWEEEGGVITVRAENPERIRYFGRYLPMGPGGVEYAVSVQYPEGMEEAVLPVIAMASRCPTGPGGTVFRGLAL